MPNCEVYQYAGAVCIKVVCQSLVLTYLRVDRKGNFVVSTNTNEFAQCPNTSFWIRIVGKKALLNTFFKCLRNTAASLPIGRINFVVKELS